MKISKRILVPAAVMLLNIFAFGQSQSFNAGYIKPSENGVKLFLETEKAVFSAGQNDFTALRSGVQKDILFYDADQKLSYGNLPVQKLKTVSADFVQKNSYKKDFVKLKADENDTTFKSKSSFWTSDLLYFTVGVAAATAAYFLISGTSAATSSQKTFGYPPPPSN